MEIERKFLIPKLPEELESFPKKALRQAYISSSPVIRIRREDDTFWLTVKGKGLLVREELNLPLSEDEYRALSAKTDGFPVEKVRYLIPLPPYTIELDVFGGRLFGLQMAEVEFSGREEAEAFLPPAWFGREVTEDPRFQNASLSSMPFPEELLKS